MPDTIHIADPGETEGFSLAHFVSHLGVTPGETATFSCKKAEDLKSDWLLWQNSLFVPHLAPAFVDAYLCGREQRINEVQAIDTMLDAKLSEPVKKRSLAAAAAFLEGKVEMRANPGWKRFSERVEKGDTPGHVAVVFALQSALYNLSLAPALTAYAWYELQSGQPKRKVSEDDFEVIFASILPHVPVALRGEKGDATDGGHLRAI